VKPYTTERRGWLSTKERLIRCHSMG